EYGYKPKNLLEDVHKKFELIGMLNRDDFKKYIESKNRSCCSGSWQNEPEALRNFVPLSPAGDITFIEFSGSTGFDSFKRNETEGSGTLGFMWFDFLKTGDSSTWLHGRGLQANEDLTKTVLDFQNKDSSKKVKGVFRAHQHSSGINRSDPSNLMSELIASNGVYNLWQPITIRDIKFLGEGLVWTFNVAPDNAYGKACKYGFDAYAELYIQGDSFKDWVLQVKSTQIINEKGYATAQSQQNL
ncbi:MAG: hypothetical protein HQ490_06290, partial [Lutibacter sp.]|nr:hypothetical protein [Lutibacter sp.]